MHIYEANQLAYNNKNIFFRAQKHMTVLIGTSGDTGSAAINAVRGLQWVDVVVLLPKVDGSTKMIF